MPFNIATGTYTAADSVLPLADTGPGITPLARVTPTSGQLTSAGDQAPVQPYASMLAEQTQAGEADVRAAQASAMAADGTRRDHYESQGMPLGGQIGDGMTLPPSPLDPGVGSLGSGEASPFGSFYDPPRPGATETSAVPGVTYLGNTGDTPQ